MSSARYQLRALSPLFLPAFFSSVQKRGRKSQIIDCSMLRVREQNVLRESMTCVPVRHCRFYAASNAAPGAPMQSY